MMLYLAPDRVNMRANENVPEPNLAVGGKIPVADATAEEGKIRFDMQIDGLVRLAKEKLERVQSSGDLR